MLLNRILDHSSAKSNNREMEIGDLLESAKILPSIRVENPAAAVSLAEAVKASGLSMIEFSLASSNALACAKAVSEMVPGLSVAVGMVTRPAEFDQLRDLAPAMVSSPGLTRALAVAARQAGFPYLPGIQTASEALAAREDGFQTLRYTPAELAGGPAGLRALAAIVPEVGFCPSGGITESSLPAYLTQNNVSCVAGSWLIPRPVVENEDWDIVTELCRRAAEKAAQLQVGRRGKQGGNTADQ